MEQKDNTDHARHYISVIDGYKSERWCEDCWLLKHLCICSNLSSLSNPTNSTFHLFLHYKEYMRTSNTGILIKKLIQGSDVHIWGIEEERQKLLKKLETQENVCVLYPGDKSIPLETWLESRSGLAKKFILLDSTWNQGRKLLNSLPENFTRVKIVNPSDSLIKCKKQANKGYLSTLECAAYILKALGDVAGFEGIMRAFVMKDKAALKQTNKHSLLKSLEESKHYDLN